MFGYVLLVLYLSVEVGFGGSEKDDVTDATASFGAYALLENQELSGPDRTAPRLKSYSGEGLWKTME